MLQDAYRWVLVDEYQDCCQLQAAILHRLAARHQNVAVVGDPLQSVYGFRGADPQLLVEFTRTFPGAQVVVLEENHRSTRAIVSLANALAAPLGQRPASWTSNPDGPPARLYVADDDEGEAQFIAGEVARLLARGELMQPGQAAVLFRTNAQARDFPLALRARGIPVRLRLPGGAGPGRLPPAGPQPTRRPVPGAHPEHRAAPAACGRACVPEAAGAD